MTTEAATPARGSTVRERLGALRSNRDFRLLWIGHATSNLGSSISTLVLPMLILALSGSAALAGLLSTVAFLTAWLAALPAGYVADMFDRRRVMLLCDLGRAVLVGVGAVAVMASVRPVPTLVVVVGMSTCLSVTFGAAETQALRTIVPAAQIPEAIGISQARGYAIGMAGPLLAGWLFAIDHALPLLVDSLTFLGSLVCVWLLGTPLKAANRPTMRRLLPDMGQGWSALWRHPFLRAMTTYSLVTNFAVSMLLFVLILGSAGAFLVGAGVSLAALAGLVGSLLAPVVYRRVPMRTLVVGVALMRAGTLVLAVVFGGGSALVVVLATVVFASPIVAGALTTAQLLIVPGDVLGRVNGASRFLSSCLQPLAPLAAGVLVQFLDRATTQLVLVGAFLVVAVVAATAPGFSRRAMAVPATGDRPS